MGSDEKIIAVLKSAVAQAYTLGVADGRKASGPDYAMICKGSQDNELLEAILKVDSESQEYRNACADELSARIGAEEFGKRLKAVIARRRS
jgi:hypothetical protein